MVHVQEIAISLDRQELTVRNPGVDAPPLLQARISSGKNGVGFELGSGKTPTGRFEVAERIGDGFGARTVFCERKPAGTWPDALPPGMQPGDDVILGRILRLRGLDEANANTWERFIYIHGTSDIGNLGRPVSHGCIRLAPEDMLALFSLSYPGMPVTIA